MPFPITSICPQCRFGEPERFSLERHTVFVCASCGYSWTAPRASAAARDPDHLAQARERLRTALLRFLRPWVYPNSGTDARAEQSVEEAGPASLSAS
jgi:hypothetical protein